MNTMLTILGVVAGAILLVVFGLGAVAAVAHSVFRFLKGVFRIGFEASKCCMTVALLLRLVLLLALCGAKCDGAVP
ncbi:MAG: hypothetical protein IJK04_13610 [Kiritimatiellae bacterium]|nr:hypothetical protein [Kiritimatiellia bacterium]